MLFMNEIARIVHGVGVEYLAIPSLNFDDSFILVWKIPDSEVTFGEYNTPPIINHSNVV